MCVLLSLLPLHYWPRRRHHAPAKTRVREALIKHSAALQTPRRRREHTPNSAIKLNCRFLWCSHLSTLYARCLQNRRSILTGGCGVQNPTSTAEKHVVRVPVQVHHHRGHRCRAVSLALIAICLSDFIMRSICGVCNISVCPHTWTVFAQFRSS